MKQIRIQTLGKTITSDTLSHVSRNCKNQFPDLPANWHPQTLDLLITALKSLLAFFGGLKRKKEKDSSSSCSSVWFSRRKPNILRTKAVGWDVGVKGCVCEKSWVKQLKREKGAVIYVREAENNAAGGRRTKVDLLCTLQLNKMSACLSEGRTPALPMQWSDMESQV